MKATRRLSNWRAQKTLREKRVAEGLTQCLVWIPREFAPDFKRAAEIAVERRWTVGRMVDEHGKVRSMK